MTQINKNIDAGFSQVPQKPYVYIITRQDLSAPYASVQAIHAAIEATKAFPQPQETVFVVLCTVPSEDHLLRFTHKITNKGVRFVSFYEPDIGNQLTAIATEPIYNSQRKIFSNLKLFNGQTAPIQTERIEL